MGEQGRRSALYQVPANRAVKSAIACSARRKFALWKADVIQIISTCVWGLRGGAASYAKIFNTGNQLPPIWHELPLAFFLGWSGAPKHLTDPSGSEVRSLLRPSWWGALEVKQHPQTVGISATHAASTICSHCKAKARLVWHSPLPAGLEGEMRSFLCSRCRKQTRIIVQKEQSDWMNG